MLILVLAQAVLCVHYKYLQIVPSYSSLVAAQNGNCNRCKARTLHMLRDKETGLQYSELIFTWLRNSRAEWQNVAACGEAVCGRPSHTALPGLGRLSWGDWLLWSVKAKSLLRWRSSETFPEPPTHLQFVYNHPQHTEHANANTHMWARLDSGHIILHQHEYNVLQYRPMSIETVNFNCPIKHHGITLYDMASQSITGSIVSVWRIPVPEPRGCSETLSCAKHCTQNLALRDSPRPSRGIA